jgi:subtilase family serine protease
LTRLGAGGSSNRLLLAVSALGTILTGGCATASPPPMAVKPVPAITGHILNHVFKAQPTSGDCLALTGVACYSPSQIEQHYDLGPLYARALDGSGSTIVIVDAFGSPTIASDLKAFDAAFGLPDPKLSIIQPAGPVPAFSPTAFNGDEVSWAFETSLDVEWSHAIAPGANIVLVETPVDETEGVQGFPEIVTAENYVIDHHLGDVISQSFGATEQTFPGVQSLLNLRSAYRNAQKHRVTVLASAGDFGATDLYADGSCCYPHAVSAWPATDPLVTSLGGTEVAPNPDGSPQPLANDVVWNDASSPPLTDGATGGGLSSVFARPTFQASVAGRVGAARGVPDISMSASISGAVLIYASFASPGYYQVAGTSEASPLFAGIVAIADQVAHHRLGFINDRLYDLGQTTNTGIVDVTSGNNDFTFADAHNGGTLTTVSGFVAQPGFDLASGWGSIDAAQFIPALVDAH